MRVAVKYCGGCNCTYDRGKMVELLRKEFPQISIVNAENEAGSNPDLVLVICGCSSVCATHQHLDGKFGKFITASETDFTAIRDAIAKLA